MTQPTKQELIDHVESLVAKCAELTHERDEARRSVCEMSLQLGQVFRRIGGKNVEVTTPEGCAEIMRWDCFKDINNA
jgi:hypothetical protein